MRAIPNRLTSLRGRIISCCRLQFRQTSRPHPFRFPPSSQPCEVIALADLPSPIETTIVPSIVLQRNARFWFTTPLVRGGRDLRQLCRQTHPIQDRERRRETTDAHRWTPIRIRILSVFIRVHLWLLFRPKRDWKRTCKCVEREENHEKGPRWSWARNQLGNINLQKAV